MSEHRNASTREFEDMHNMINIQINIASMPDPLDIFSTTLKAAEVSQSFVHIPNSCDDDQNIILPYDYDFFFTKQFNRDGQHFLKTVSLYLFP